MDQPSSSTHEDPASLSNVFQAIGTGKLTQVLLATSSSSPYAPYVFPLMAVSCLHSPEPSSSTFLFHFEEMNHLRECLLVIKNLTREEIDQYQRQYPDLDSLEDFHAMTATDQILWVVSNLERDGVSQIQKGASQSILYRSSHEMDHHDFGMILVLLYLIQPEWYHIPSTSLMSTFVHHEVGGHYYLFLMVMNDPHIFGQVWHHILVEIKTSENSEQLERELEPLMLRLCDLSSPAHAILGRQACLEHHVCPKLVLQLTMEYIKDELMFLISILTITKTDTDNELILDHVWFWRWFKQVLSGQITSTSGEHSSDMITMVRLVLLKRVDDGNVLSRVTGLSKLSSILRTFAGLVGCGGLQCRDHELSKIFHTITETLQTMEEEKEDEAQQSTFISLALSTVMLLTSNAHTQNLLSSQHSKHNHKILASVHSVLQSLYAAKVARPTFILLSLYFYTNQHPQAWSWVRQTLGLPVELELEKLWAFGQMFLRPMVTEVMMTRDILVSRFIDTDTVCRCVYMLLCEKSFHRHRLNLRDWILKCIQSSRKEILVHRLFPMILTEYVEGCFRSPQQSSSSMNNFTFEPIPVVVMHAIMSSVSNYAIPEVEEKGEALVTAFAPVMLTSIYALTFNQRIQKDGGFNHRRLPYPVQVYPLRYVLTLASKHPLFITSLYPTLLDLVKEACPELKVPIINMSTTTTMILLPNVSGWKETLTQGRPEVEKIVSIFNQILAVPSSEFLGHWTEVVLTQALPHWVSNFRTEGRFPIHLVLNKLRECWEKTLEVHARPHVFELLTLNVFFNLSTSSPGQTTKKCLEYQSLIQEPYTVFRCDVFILSESPALFQMLLLILMSLREASSSIMNNQTTLDHNDNQDKSLPSPVVVRDSILIHALFNILETSPKFRTEVNMNQVILSTIDKLWTEPTRSVFQLVHQQGFARSMLPLLLTFRSPIYHETKILSSETWWHNHEDVGFLIDLVAHITRQVGHVDTWTTLVTYFTSRYCLTSSVAQDQVIVDHLELLFPPLFIPTTSQARQDMTSGLTQLLIQLRLKYTRNKVVEKLAEDERLFLVALTQVFVHLNCVL